jgi:hypothetical protein
MSGAMRRLLLNHHYNVDKIMNKLIKAVGPGGLYYLVPVGPDTKVLLDDALEEEGLT